VKRRSTAEAAVPLRLAHLIVDDWSPGDPSAAYAAWQRTRREWAAEHGWPGGEQAMRAEEFAAAISLPDERWRW
jgi:hypothetical protein